MDLSPFKVDIDELIDEFGKGGSTSLMDMKKIWCSKKFSFIFEASPSSNLGFFMQSLYEHTMGHMLGSAALSHRVGGLYCIYCLHETQPFKPPFRIYLSLGHLKKVIDLVRDTKTAGIGVVSALVARMLENNIFLFGCVDIKEGCFMERMNELTEMQNALVQAAHKRLLANTRIEHYIHLDLAKEFDLEALKRISTEYSKAKQVAINEASEVADVQNIRHIAQSTTLVGDVVEKLVDDWNVQKESFYQRSGLRPPRRIPLEQECSDDFAIELENLLT